MNLDSKRKNRARNPPRWIPAMIVVGNHPNMACFTTTIMAQNISFTPCPCNRVWSRHVQENLAKGEI